jgi:hypothetical protein
MALRSSVNRAEGDGLRVGFGYVGRGRSSRTRPLRSATTASNARLVSPPWVRMIPSRSTLPWRFALGLFVLGLPADPPALDCAGEADGEDLVRCGRGVDWEAGEEVRWDGRGVAVAVDMVK